MPVAAQIPLGHISPEFLRSALPEIHWPRSTPLLRNALAVANRNSPIGHRFKLLGVGQ
jgi:hypothetical protein